MGIFGAGLAKCGNILFLNLRLLGMELLTRVLDLWLVQECEIGHTIETR